MSARRKEKTISNYKHFFFFCFLLLIAGCEVNGSKRKTQVQDSILVSLTTSTQFATESSKYQSIFPFVQSFSAAADSTSSMQWLADPQEGCFPTQALEQTAWNQMQLQRAFNVGEVVVRDSSKESTELSKTDDNVYFTRMPLSSGGAKITSEGVKNGSLKMDSNFTVPSIEGNISVFEIDEERNILAQYDLVSPEIPTSADTIVFKKDGLNVVAYEAPEGTDYVKVTIDDGRSVVEGSFTCISKPEFAILLPNDYLGLLRSTAEAKVQVEFVDVHNVNDVSRIKIGHIISSMVHMQGSIVYIEDNETQTDSFGRVIIE